VVSKPTLQFCLQNNTVAETSKLYKSLPEISTCSPVAWENSQEMWEAIAVGGHGD